MFQVRVIYGDGVEEVKRCATREIATDQAEENVYAFLQEMQRSSPSLKFDYLREVDIFDVERFRIMQDGTDIVMYEVSDGRNAYTVYH